MGCCSSKKSEQEERSVDRGHNQILTGNARNFRQNTGAVVQISASHSSAAAQQLSDVELLCRLTKIDYKTSENVIEMFKAGNTIPFMCRYRRHKINNMDAEEMRSIKIAFNQVEKLRARAAAVIQELQIRNQLNDTLHRAILSAKSVAAIEHVYGPFKPASKLPQQEKAIALGLGEVAEQLLKMPGFMPAIANCVDPRRKGVENLHKVQEGIKNIISHVFCKDTDVLEAIQDIAAQKRNDISMETVENVNKTKQYTDSAEENQNDRIENPKKFDRYFQFRAQVSDLQSHQIMAINRGESLGYLIVKIMISNIVQNKLQQVLDKKYRLRDPQCPARAKLLLATFKQSYSNKLKAVITREVRSYLKTFADKISVEVFAKNLKQLLLMRPVKGQKILGIDPGFRYGCKLALISEQNAVLATTTIYPHARDNKSAKLDIAEQILAALLKKHGCELIAIGNGKAGRETEIWIANMIRRNLFHLKSVRYCTVSEDGASVYSCSDIAKREFPNMDINLISAVSIARRLSDPLAELVKIEPKHLGVGMYQHDIDDKYLMETLDEVVMECVSFVGVDINTASVSLLKYIAGLNEVRAKDIIAYRTKYGPFRTRNDIQLVKSIGPQTYEQCAGFIRIDPVTSNGIGFNILDSTWVHPESYVITINLLKNWGLRVYDVGTPQFVQAISMRQSQCSTNAISKMYGATPEQISSIIEALSREQYHDYRDDSNIQPMMKQKLIKMADIQKGQILVGTARNVTTFGCFVDIGVESDGLIHTTKMAGKTLNIGDRVKVTVVDIDLSKEQIKLKLESIL